MESSRKLSCNNLLEHVTDALSPALPEGSSVVLGLSGGVDSVVLLHLLRHIADRHLWRLSALHVHHGISPQADDWAKFCAELCTRLNTPLKIERVNIAPLRHLGIEAAARTLRHEALARQPANFIALAHHQDDQAETLLLQLLRGAGVRGVSAMPAFKFRDGAPALLRPLLDIPRSTLLNYARQHDLQWVEDESNADNTYPRNFLRHCVLPLLEQKFPAYRTTLARSARNFAEASELLEALARQDASGVIVDGRLDIAPLRLLSAAHGKNLLRYFIASCAAPMPDSALLDEILRQISTARRDAQLCVTWKRWQLRRYHDHAYVLPVMPPPVDFSITWHGEPEVLLPQPHGLLRFKYVIGHGFNPVKLQSASLEIRPRRGGENIRPDAARPQRTLKNILQEHDILPWQRAMLPLLFCGTELVCVPGMATACAYLAQADESGVLVSWHP